MKSRILNVLFKLSCVFITISLIIFAIYKYLLDKDIAVIAFTKFHEQEKDIYPSVMLCFYNPFVSKQFVKYGSTINSTVYKNFLRGEIWSQELANVDFDDVTLDIDKYFLKYRVLYSEQIQDTSYGTYSIMNKSTLKPGWKSPYVSLKAPFMKCFTVDIPFEAKKNIIKLSINLKTDIFPLSIRPPEITLDSDGDINGGFSVLFHYQRQLFRNINFLKSVWPLRTEHSSKNYAMNFNLQNIEVISI